ncbi:MAG: hypothetical protein ACREIF_10655 [Chthoniobacterales bacterium]
MIGALAEKYGAPVFEPHLTLGLLDQLPILSDQLFVGLIQLKAARAFSSSTFVKTLLVRLRSVLALEKLLSSLA